ncbi:MAG TPA: hypothetical protein VI423_11965 [Paenisporosarcina sp.]|nr:hypothetical protein [Paenisporosarcina sp.]
MLENKPVAPSDTKRETQAYGDALLKKENAAKDLMWVKKILAQCDTNLEQWLTKKEPLKYSNPLYMYRADNVDVMALEDHLMEQFDENSNLLESEKEAEKQIAFLTETKPKLEKMLFAAQNNYMATEQNLKSVPQYEILQPLAGLLSGLLKENDRKKPDEEKLSAQTEPEKTEPKRIENEPAIQNNGKLISSRELREMKYKCLNFQGKWKDFFGLPATVFHLAVHGKPGEGKSTFCIQFADYLAKNFGRVVYISGEEGFSKTLRDKVVNNKIDNPHLFFADISSFEQIKNEIENNKFHFVFIDSLDTLRIDAVKLRELREHYPQSAFITISQSTKDGKMRGSQEIIHDTDIAAKVEDGMAITTKNRYHPRGTEFRVFPSQEKAFSKFIEEPRNMI